MLIYIIHLYTKSRTVIEKHIPYTLYCRGLYKHAQYDDEHSRFSLDNMQNTQTHPRNYIHKVEITAQIKES